jgi:hypothetical protein
MHQRTAAQAETTFRQEHAHPPATPGVREQLDATTRAFVAADEAYLREARGSVQWEERGPLRRLVRRAHMRRWAHGPNGSRTVST